MDDMEEEALILSQNFRTEKDWVTLLCDSSRTGGLGIRALKAPKRARWQLHVGNSVRSAPIFRGETLYVASLSGGLHAIDVQSGRTRWKFLAGDQIHSTPSFCGNMVLFGCDDGKVYAVDDNTGTKVWEAAASAEIWASPTVRSAVVYFGSADGWRCLLRFTRTAVAVCTRSTPAIC